LPADHELLHTQISRFDFDNPPVDPIEFAHLLVENMLHHGGIGLAANQIGQPYRVFAVAAKPVIVAYNPVIVNTTTETVELEEGCLTFPNLILKIKRPSAIRIRYTLPNGTTETYKYVGMTARIMQHETDHLNGVVFTEHVGPVALSLAKAKARKLEKLNG
jgi:peptide deformylase